ncbi:hypothetical protein [Pedobacter cryoconitis]|uniref:Uncharacterized protein n=1 Tax=Pedobacter cryoconitis TaxID=188932 RepID=A0A327SKM9_9SPHI|nr:hypothetical protein [Pedobacter cryoconitis]RAJ28083.1 hypothetical protein LY11_03403 [Pedobacter cryoconitis]
MLQQFSWQHFLVAISLLTLIWYVAVILIFYRKELKSFLKGKPSEEPTDKPLPHYWDDKVDEFPVETDDDLMGKSKMPEGVSVIDMEELQFSEPEDKTEKLGLVSDVIEEIKLIFKILGQEDGNKQDFLKLIGEVKNRYPKIASSPSLPQINEFILSNASFHLSPEELEDLW